MSYSATYRSPTVSIPFLSFFLALSMLTLAADRAYSQAPDSTMMNMAVLNFETDNMAGDEARLFAERLTNSLIASGCFKIIDDIAVMKELEAWAGELRFPSSDRLIDNSRVLKSANKIITGSLNCVFGQYVAIARIIDIEKGAAECSFKVMAESKETAIGQSPQILASKILKQYSCAGMDRPKTSSKEAASPHKKPDMMLVKGGEFFMGSAFNEWKWKNLTARSRNEQPLHKVWLPAYFIGKYEVTYAEFSLFCDAAGRERPDNFGWVSGRLPVMNITWYDAADYCNWLSERDGLEKAYDGSYRLNTAKNGYRLPSEAEWEKAARGGLDRKMFAWGNEIPDGGKCNFSDIKSGFKYLDTDIDDGWRNTSEIGFYPPNSYGLYDMTGNVSEWCGDWYGEYYYASSPNKSPLGLQDGKLRAIRGGGWDDDLYYIRVSYRMGKEPRESRSDIGFRLARNAK